MTQRRAYEADAEVIGECTRRGVEVSARQLERWRPFLLHREVEHLPAGLGTKTENPPDYVDQVIAVHKLVESGLALREVPVTLFAQGFPISRDVLVEAYLEILGLLRAEAESTGLGDDDPLNTVDALARRMAHSPGRRSAARQWLRRARQLVRSRKVEGAGDAEDLLAAGMTAMLTGLLTGTTPTPEGVVEALTVMGLNDGRDPEQAALHLAAVSLDALEEAVRSATPRDWATARGDLHLLLEYREIRLRLQSAILPEEHQLVGLSDVDLDAELRKGVMIPIFLLADQDWRTAFRRELNEWRAADHLYNYLPEEFRLFVGPDTADEVSRQSADLKSRLMETVSGFVEQYPDEARMLGLLPPRGESVPE